MTREQYYAGRPKLAPQAAGETAEAFGLRALSFAVEHGPEAIEDAAALELAGHVYPLVICGEGTSQKALENLAEVERRIQATRRRRAELDRRLAAEGQKGSPAGQDAPGRANGGGTGKGPSGGSKVPRAPQGPRDRGPAPARVVPAQPVPVADLAF